MISARVRAEPDTDTATAADAADAADTDMTSKHAAGAAKVARTPRNSSGDDEEETHSSPAASPTAASAADEEEEEEAAPMRRTAASRTKRRSIVSEGDDDDEPIMIDASPPAVRSSPHFASPASAAQSSPPASKRLQRLKRGREEEAEERKQASAEEDAAEDDDGAEESKEAPARSLQSTVVNNSKPLSSSKRKRDALDSSPESVVDRDDEEYEQIPDEEDDEEDESPEAVDDDSEEEYGAPSKRKQTASRASARPARTSARGKRTIRSSSEEEEEASDAEEEKEDSSDSEASVGKPKRGAAQAKKQRSAAKESTATSSKRAAASKAAKSSSDAPPVVSMRSYFSPQASVPGSLSARAAEEYAVSAAKRNQERTANKKSARQASESEVDEEEAEEEEDVPRSRSGRALRNLKLAAIVAPSVPAAPTGSRRSSRSVQRMSYKEPSDAIEEVSPDAPKPAKPARVPKTISIDDEEANDADAAAAEDDDADAQNSEDDAEAVKRDFAQARSKATKRSKVIANKSLKKRRSRASGDDEDESVNSEEERALEKAWERKEGLLNSDAEDSPEDASDDEMQGNPVDKILARRQVQIPDNHNDGRTVLRMEFLIKYKDLSYAQSDWIDRKTIELWTMGKSRLSHWAKREKNEDFTEYRASTADATTNKLFKAIREFELRVFERDEKEGIGALVEAEETRINKRIHPSLKTILKVWVPSGADNSSAVIAEDGDEAEGAGAHLFDPAYLEVDRIVGRRMAAGFEETKGTEAAKYEYLVKWCNLSYKDLSWESSDYVGDEAPNFIPLDCVKRFEASLKFPTAAQLKISRDFQDGKRPKLEVFTDANPCPPFPGDRHLRDYQIEGVNWFNVNFVKGINGILADEMGLGKTVQTCAFLRTLFSKGLRGPFLVLAPLSCTPHWQREFESWVPEMSVVSYAGTSDSRDMASTYEFSWTKALGDSITGEQEKAIKSLPRKTIRANVVISSYDTMRSDLAFFKSIEWQVLVVDEAHQIKNEQTKLYQSIAQCKFDHKVFLTGTPIQNNLGELFTLLQMIDEDKFPSREEFVAKYRDLQTTGTSKDVTDLHDAIRPYMFRRMKGDVEKSLPPREETLIEVEMTSVQKQYYRAVFERNVDFLAGKDKTKKTVASLMNVAMQLRKHPYLLEGVENSQIVEHNFEHYLTDAAMQHMIACSGKLVLIDKLLTKLKAEGKQVLIFSQMVRALDVIEDYLNWRGWKHERLDGSTAGAHRQASIDRFSRKGSDRFVFMLSTKAGGIGINLTAASTVIIFDSDPCPQGDVQAMARAHRIGQKEKVSVYRLICSGTYEAELFEKANMKLGLDQAVLHTMDKNSTMKMDKKEVESLLRKGAAYMLRADDAKAEAFCAADIDTILSKNARTINFDQPSVGAASARSGLSSFTHATFNAGAAGEQAVRFDDPLFWDKIGVQSEAKQAKHVASKRAHKQMFDLKKAGGRGDQGDEEGDAEPQDWCGASDESDEDGEGKKKKKRSAKQDEDLVVFDEPDADEQERFYDAGWSRRQRERFLAALHRYGYHRLAELKPYFPNQTLREMKSLALSYIVFLALKLKGSKASTIASTLLGVVREDMLLQLDEHWKSKQHDSGEQAPRYHAKQFDDLLASYVPCFEPCINDPKFIEQFEKTSKHLLQDLNRLAVLHYQFATLKPQQPAAPVTVDLSHESQSPEAAKMDTGANGAAAASASSAAATPSAAVPNLDKVDTTRHVNLPVVVPTTLHPLVSSITSHKDKDTPDWWVGEVHDPALLLGVRALGYQGNLSNKGARKLWDELRFQSGLVFNSMEFGKAKRKPRKSKEQKEQEEKDAAAGKPEAMQIDGGDNSVDSADYVMVAAPPAAASADAPAAAAAAADSASSSAAAPVAPSVEPASDEPELPVWPTPLRLKNRFAYLMSQLEKTQKAKLPRPTVTARVKVVAAGSNNSSASAKGSKSEAPEESFQLPAAPFTWSANKLKSVYKTVDRHGVPSEREFKLPAEFFTRRSNATPSEDAAAGVKMEDEPMADGASASPAFHVLKDDWKSFRHHAECASVPLDKVQELVKMTMDRARKLEQSLHGSSKEKLQELKAELRTKKDEKKGAGKSHTGSARGNATGKDVDELLAEELTINNVRRFLERTKMCADLKAVMSECADLRSALDDFFPLPLPFPSYRPKEDDAGLLVGILKYGWSVNACGQMREDPCISTFKTLKPETKAAKPKTESKTAAAGEDSKPEAIDVDSIDAPAAAAAASSATAPASKSKDKAEPKALIDWHIPQMTKRVQALIQHLRSRQRASASVVPSSVAAPPSPLSKPSRSSSQLTDSPAKVTHQKTLGASFSVKDELVLDEPPKGKSKASPHKSTPPSSVKKEKKPAASAAAAKTATPKKSKALSDSLNASAQPKKSSPAKAAPATHVHTKFNPQDYGGDDIEDDFEVSPDARKKQRTDSPAPAAAAAAPSGSPAKAASSLVYAADDLHDDFDSLSPPAVAASATRPSDVEEIEMISPPPAAKKSRTENGSKVTAAKPAATTPSPAKVKAKSTAASSSKPSASSSGKKKTVDKNTPPVSANNSIKQFFTLKTSVSALKPISAPKPAAAAAAASSPAAAKQKPEVTTIDE